MATLTITEGLAELKTLAARLAKKRQFVSSHLTRDADRLDPLDKQGGSINAVKEAMQGIHDLEERVVAIRSAINRANANTKVTIADTARTVEQWLVWRREVSRGQVEFLGTIRKILDQARARDPYAGRSKDDQGFIVNIDEKKLGSDMEQLVTILGELDGKLSVVNATTHIELEA